MRKTPAGSVFEAVKKAIQAAGGLECAARDLSVSSSLLSRATNPHEDQYRGGIGVNHLDTLCRIVPEAAVPIAEHFARLAGGHFQTENPEPVNDIHALVKEFGDVLKNHGDALSADSPDPTRFTPDEANRALKEVRDLSKALLAYRTYLESCLVGPVKNSCGKESS